MISDNAIFRLIWIYPEVGIFLPPWQIFTFMHKEGDMGICSVANFFFCGIAVNKIPSCGLAVISNHVMFFILSLWCLVKKNYLWTLCDVLIYCLTHLTDLPLLSNCQNLFTSCANVFPFPRTFLEHLKIGEQKSNCGVGGLSAFFCSDAVFVIFFLWPSGVDHPPMPPSSPKVISTSPLPPPSKTKMGEQD